MRGRETLRDPESPLIDGMPSQGKCTPRSHRTPSPMRSEEGGVAKSRNRHNIAKYKAWAVDADGCSWQYQDRVLDETISKDHRAPTERCRSASEPALTRTDRNRPTTQQRRCEGSNASIAPQPHRKPSRLPERRRSLVTPCLPKRMKREPQEIRSRKQMPTTWRI